MSFPDALLLENLVVFPNAISRGYALSLPDLSQAQPAVLNGFATLWENFFKSFPPAMRLQFQTHRIADFGGALDRYASLTPKTGNAWSRRVREERHSRYRERMRAGELLREQTIIFFSLRSEHMPHLFSSPYGLEGRYQILLKQAASQIQQVADNLVQLLAGHGGHLTALSDADHHRYFARWLNPSLTRRPDFDPLVTFDPARSVHTNCWWSEAAGADFGFTMDSHYHALRVFTRWPRQLTPITLHPLWQLPGGNYRVTLNLRYLDERQIISRGERQLRRLEGQYQTERKPSLLPAIEKLRKRIENLAAGSLRPLAVEVVVHTWATTPEALAGQCAAIEQAIHASGAQYYSPTLPTTSKRLLAQSWPGYPWGNYPHYQLYAESTFAPQLLPLVASFTGYVDEADALYESAQGSLMGIRTTSGGQPLHFVAFGGTGSGKSMFLQDLISQIAAFFEFISIIDYGESYETLVRVLDPESRPLVVRANAAFTINYLETHGLPLTSEYLADAAAIVSLMAGKTDEREDRLRRVVVTAALRQLYAARFNELERKEPERAFDLARHALALRSRHSAGADLLDDFIDFRDWRAAHADEAQSLMQRFTEGEALAFLKDPSTRPFVVALSCASLAPEAQPTHRELQQWLRLHAAAADEPVAAELSTLLEDWCRGGACGELLDGVSTVSLDRPVVCWEMGKLDEKLPALQHIARYLVQTQTWKQIYARSRARTLLLFEETSAFVEMPGADALLRRGYEQARKFNAVLGTVFQSYSRLRALPIRATLMGSAQQFFLLKQDDLTDLKQLVDDLGLPTSVMDAVKKFPKPAEAGYADSALFSRDTPHPVCGVARHVPSPEMHYVTCSTPAHVEARRAALRSEQDLFTKIQQLTK